MVLIKRGGRLRGRCEPNDVSHCSPQRWQGVGDQKILGGGGKLLDVPPLQHTKVPIPNGSSSLREESGVPESVERVVQQVKGTGLASRSAIID
ncbi:hypothetical protein KC320_g246 [Hortaea werneckii]|nr:hypothetical protein KC320_g246 [Hortaea werneckii]